MKFLILISVFALLFFVAFVSATEEQQMPTEEVNNNNNENNQQQQHQQQQEPEPQQQPVEESEQQQKDSLLRQNVVIHRARIDSEYDEMPIDIFDEVFIPGFDVLREMDQFREKGVRVMKFGDSHQTTVATKQRPPAPSWPEKILPTNESFPLQSVDWDARPVFRYNYIIAQGLLFYELRAENFNNKINNNNNNNQVTDGQQPPKKVPSTVEKVLLVGLGGGSIIKTLEKLIPSYSSASKSFFKRVDIVELDENVIRVAEKYFDFKNATAPQNYNIIHGDAFDVLNDEANKRNDEMKYDLIILDCASSGPMYNKDMSYPLRPKGITSAPEVSQPLSCFKPSFLKLLPAFYLRDPEAASLVVCNFVGFIEPIHTMAQKPTLRVLKTFKTAFQRDSRPIVQPGYLRKWKDGFRPRESGHRNAKVFDNLVIYAAWKNSFEPSITDMVEKVRNEVRVKHGGNYEESRFNRIAEQGLFLDLIKNRYKRQMSEMEDDVVILPRTEKKKPTIKVKELPDYYVPLKERDEDDKKVIKGSIWHDY